MKPDFDLSLYLATDRNLMSTTTLERAVEQAVEGGAALVQLYEEDASSLDFYRMTLSVKRMTDAKEIPLIINDRMGIVLTVDTAGVHVGQEDLPVKMVRAILGEDKLLGVSVSIVGEVPQAERDDADYLGVGAMFTAGTKTDAQLVSMEELREIRLAASTPIVAAGGINIRTIPLFRRSGIGGAAVVSAIIAVQDIATAARGLKDPLEQQKPAYRE